MLRLISLVLLIFCSSCSIHYHKHEHTHLSGNQIQHTEEKESVKVAKPETMMDLAKETISKLRD